VKGGRYGSRYPDRHQPMPLRWSFCSQGHHQLHGFDRCPYSQGKTSTRPTSNTWPKLRGRPTRNCIRGAPGRFPPLFRPAYPCRSTRGAGQKPTRRRMNVWTPTATGLPTRASKRCTSSTVVICFDSSSRTPGAPQSAGHLDKDLRAPVSRQLHHQHQRGNELLAGETANLSELFSPLMT